MSNMLTCKVIDCIPAQFAFVVVNGHLICKGHWDSLMKEGAELAFAGGEVLKLPHVKKISKENSQYAGAGA